MKPPEDGNTSRNNNRIGIHLFSLNRMKEVKLAPANAGGGELRIKPAFINIEANTCRLPFLATCGLRRQGDFKVMGMCHF